MPSHRSDLPIFNSRDARFKSPYGAVPAGTPVTLTLRPYHGDGYTYGLVEAYLEFWNNHKIEITMPFVRIEDERDIFSTMLDIGNYVGLVWNLQAFRTWFIHTILRLRPLHTLIHWETFSWNTVHHLS